MKRILLTGQGIRSVVLNHKTKRFRLVSEGETVGHADEVEYAGDSIIQGFDYTPEGNRVFVGAVKVVTQ